MNEKVIVVTGCDANHFTLAADTLASLRDLGAAGFETGFIHIGAEPLPAEIAAGADHVLHVDDSAFLARPRQGYVVAYLGVKARLPELFPGFDVYIWLDSDAWVQKAAGLATLIEAARHADIGLHAESGENYARIRLPDYRNLSTYFSLFPDVDAAAYLRLAMVNAGVFAARAASPVWGKWFGLLDQIRRRADDWTAQFHSDQIPLHSLTVLGEVSYLPVSSLNNWQVYTIPPTLNLGRRRLLSPFPPYDEINIVHLSGPSKGWSFKVDETGPPMTFRYRDIRALFTRQGGGAGG
jgi:hypothetical protein